MSRGVEALGPRDVARRVVEAGAAKAALSPSRLFALATLAGAFIAFGALAYTLTTAESALGVGPTRLLGGVAFATGLVLVIVAGAELFTGDTLMIVPLLDHRLNVGRMLFVWVVVYAGNFAGALIIAGLVAMSGALEPAPAFASAARIADAKMALEPAEALARGILCNMLVCLAVWMTFAARRVSGKILAIVPPVAIFVALGFEHSVANMFVLPAAMMVGASPADFAGFFINLAFVTVGNVIGGAAVATTYWGVHLR